MLAFVACAGLPAFGCKVNSVRELLNVDVDMLPKEIASLCSARFVHTWVIGAYLPAALQI